MTANLSRRQFLKIASVGASAAFLGKLGFDLSPAQVAALDVRRQTGVLRVAWEVPATLDPIAASADTEIAFLNAVYDYLIDTDAGSTLIPRLASEWSVSEDGLTYTLKIREGVTFHDGSPLTVEDVLWSLNRLQEAEIIESLSSVTSIEAGEDNSVVFTLSATNPDFLYALSDNRALILKANAELIGEEFNGTGPFVLQEYLVGNRAVFTPNENYWDGAPALESLEFLYFSDGQAAISALQGGELDVALRMDNATFLSLKDTAGFVGVDIPTNGHDLVRIRSDREPGSDVRVRQAFRLATDRQAIYDRIQFGFGAVGNDTPIGPLYADYFASEYPVPARDVEAARALLTEAGYADGLDMTLYVPNSGDRPRLAEVLKAQWEEAGIRVEIELQDEATYYADNGWLEVDLGITGWGSRPFPQFYLNESLKTGARWNESHFSDEELDTLIELAETSTNQEERVQAYKEIQRILIERGPLIVPYYFAALMVTADYVEGVNLHPFPGRTNFHKATV